MSIRSTQLSLMTPSPLLLYSVSSTLLIALSVPLIFLAPLLARALRSTAVSYGDRTAISLALASIVLLVLHGVCALVSIGNGSFGAAVAGGIFGALSLFSADAQAIMTTLTTGNTESASCSRSGGLAVTLSSLFVVSAMLQVVLLAFEQPSHRTLFGLTHARAIFHLAFDLAIAAVLVKRLVCSVSKTDSHHDVESRYANNISTFALANPKLAARKTETRATELLRRREISLLALQVLSTLLSILTLSIPITPNYLPIADEFRFVPPSVFGGTPTPAGSIVIAIVIALRWTGSLFELASNVLSVPLSIDETATSSMTESPGTQAPGPASASMSAPEQISTATSINRDSGSSVNFRTPESSTSTSDRLFTERSRSHSVSSLLSFGANLPPRISEECERTTREEEYGGNTDDSDDYVHTETFPAPFAIELDRRLSRSLCRPRSTSSPEPYEQSHTPRTPSPVTPRTRKDAGRLSRPNFDRAPSTASSFGTGSPILARPSLNIDVNLEDPYRPTGPCAPTRFARPGSSGRSTPSPTKTRRPSLRSLVGISPPRLASTESLAHTRGARRGSRSSSISYLRGRYLNDGAATPTLEIETDEEDPFAAVQASQAIEATRKVEEWAQRRAASEKESLATAGGGFEEDIEIISPTRESFERLHSPIRITTSALAHLHDPSLHPRGRSPSSSNSLFHEHLPSSPMSPNVRLDSSRSRSGSLGSAFNFASTSTGSANPASPPYRFGKSFSSSPTLSPSSTSTRLLEAIGVKSSPSRPPRADSLSSRPVSSQVERKEESPEQVRARTRSSAPPPTTSDSASPRSSPVRRLFSRRPSATGRFFSSSPPILNCPVPSVPRQSRKHSRASSTFSSTSFSLSKLRRGSTSVAPKPLPVVHLGVGGTTFAQSRVSTAGSFRMSETSDLSFMCRGEGGGSSYQSSARPSLSRSVSLDFEIGATSAATHPSDSLEGGPARGAAEPAGVPRSMMKISPTTRTSNWWTQKNFDARDPLAPYYRDSQRRYRAARLGSNSAPDLVASRRSSIPTQQRSNKEAELAAPPESSQARRSRSQSLPPLDRQSRYDRLETRARISRIGSLALSFDEHRPTRSKSPSRSSSLAPPIDLAVQTCAEPAWSFLPPSRLDRNASSSAALGTYSRRRDRTISSDEVEELTELYETFTPVGGENESPIVSRTRLSLALEDSSAASRFREFELDPLVVVTPGLSSSSSYTGGATTCDVPSPSTLSSTSPTSWSDPYDVALSTTVRSSSIDNLMTATAASRRARKSPGDDDDNDDCFPGKKINRLESSELFERAAARGHGRFGEQQQQDCFFEATGESREMF